MREREYFSPFNDLVVGKTYRVQHYHFNDLIMEDMGRVNEIDGSRITFERVGYGSTFGHLDKIGEIYHVDRYRSPVFGHNYRWRVFEYGQDAYVRRTDSLRREVPLKDLIVGKKYDLHISVIDRPNTMGFETLKEDDRYDLENMTFKGKKDKDKWATKHDNDKLLFEDSDGKKTTVEGDRTYKPHPDNLNKAYIRINTIGDVLSTKNPDKKQSSAALQALTPLYGNTDMMKHIMKYGGKNKNKKKKTKTLKRTKSAKRIRKMRSVKTRKSKKKN